jgi:pimeloyl-ACP methyl ester carboxylesterase
VESGLSSTTSSISSTAPTRYVDGDGVRFAYRRFGEDSGVPLVLVQHFRGNLDSYDPLILDALAQDRELVLFDNRGVGSTNGIARETIQDMANDTRLFIDALGIRRCDVFGHSMGGHVSQVVALDRPDLVRRLILVGTGPRGGEGMAGRPPEVAALWTKQYEDQDEMWLPIFFSPSEESQAAGRRFLERRKNRPSDRAAPVSAETATAHRTAASAWGVPTDPPYAYLHDIAQPTLVVNGSNDIIVPTVNSYILQQHLPHAQLILYPDSGHGVHFQYPEEFVDQAARFLQRA